MYWLNLANSIAGLGFSVIGTVATVTGLIPTLRHKVVKSIAYSAERGRMDARR